MSKLIFNIKLFDLENIFHSDIIIGMRCKLIISDYDNTVTSTKGIVTENTLSAIRKFEMAGGEFILCTSRPYVSVKHKAKELGLKNEIICSQGSSIRNLTDDSTIFDSVIPSYAVEKMLEFSEAIAKYIVVASDEEIYANRTNFIFKTFAGKFGYVIDNTDALEFEEKALHIPVNQFIIGSLTISKNNLIAQKATEYFGEEFNVNVCDKYLISITNKNSSKGKAIETVSNLKKVKKEEIAVFGDSLGDLSMFDYAGLSVAMDNASRQLKRAANEIAPHTDKDGLSLFIEEKILN